MYWENGADYVESKMNELDITETTLETNTFMNSSNKVKLFMKNSSVFSIPTLINENFSHLKEKMNELDKIAKHLKCSFRI